VEDTGPGIPPDQQQRVFEAFTQADASTTRGYGGSGLGLTISKRLITLMGGEIRLHSRPGQGACFTCQVPVGRVEASAAVTDIAPVISQEAQFAARVLLAEDHSVNRLVARGMLETFGCRVAEVENGRQAVAAVQGERFDLVLMDCHMPELDGFAAAREIRAAEAAGGAPRVPILALTADVQKGIMDHCRAAGMDDYLAKPLKLATLHTALGRWVPTRVEPKQAPGTAAPVAAMATVLLNSVVLDELRTMNEALLRSIIALYLEQLPRHLDALRAAAVTDPGEVRRIANKLKASSASLGAESLSALFLALERAGAAADLPGIAAALAEIEILWPPVSRALETVADDLALPP
jgi:CheY-like chemotaxis protein/HPt (histidine-containing phosphotransfer) domain-containing protein